MPEYGEQRTSGGAGASFRSDRPTEIAEAVRWEASFEPLTAAFRGGALESVHRGVVAVADTHGRLLGGLGDPEVPVLLRSAAKPFQALAVVASGAADALSLTSEELAVMCASHAGQPEHVRTVAGLLERLGLAPEHLVCGTHPPFSRSARADLQRSGAPPSVLQNNCSGKHAGMLGLALFLGAPLDGYEEAGHPVQREIVQTVARLLGRSDSQGLLCGIDGCGVPVFRMKALECATLFARLAQGSHPALRRVRDAMMAHPGLVGGEGRFDTLCMRLRPDRLVTKAGAEGAQGLGLTAGGGDSRPVGCFIKLADGTSDAIPMVAGAFLGAWGDAEAGETLAGKEAATVRTLAGRVAGEVRFLGREADLRRREPLAPGSTEGTSPGGRPGLEAAPGIVVGAVRAGERGVARFLRAEWPAADVEILGRSYEWLTEDIDLVAREGRRVVGVLRGRFTAGVATVRELLVHHDYRGRGIGTRLVRSMEAEARARGCHKVRLRTPSGARAESFYRGLHYTRECVVAQHHHGHDYAEMVKRLS